MLVFLPRPSLFGVKAEFDWNLYTTPLDKGSLTPEQILCAERLAAEIIGGNKHGHLREERSMVREGSKQKLHSSIWLGCVSVSHRSGNFI